MYRYNYFVDRKKEDDIKAIYTEYRKKYPPLQTVEDMFNLNDMIIGEIVDRINDIDPHYGKILKMKLQRLHEIWKPYGAPKVKWYDFENAEAMNSDEQKTKIIENVFYDNITIIKDEKHLKSLEVKDVKKIKDEYYQYKDEYYQYTKEK